MRKRMNNTRLLLVFFVLLILVVVLFTKKDGYKERSFNKQLVKVEPGEVNEIRIFPRQLEGGMILINKSEGGWEINDQGNRYEANDQMIDQMVSTISGLTAKSLVANSKDRWESYEVSDSLATIVELYNNKKQVTKVHIGKFQFVQPQSMFTYLRVDGKKETYKVDGFLTSTFNKKPDDLRDKTLVDDELANWSSLTFDYPADSSFVLSKDAANWLIDGVLADNEAIKKYINSIKKQSGSNIAENINETAAVKFRLTIERDNLNPLVFEMKQNGQQRVLSSSESDLWFRDEHIIKRIFVAKDQFLLK